MDVEKIDENYRQLNEMLEKALNAIKDESSNKMNFSDSMDNHPRINSENFNQVLKEINQDLNSTQKLYENLTKHQDVNNTIQTVDPNKKLKDKLNVNNLDHDLENLQTNIRDLELKLSNSAKKQNIELDHVSVNKINFKSKDDDTFSDDEVLNISKKYSTNQYSPSKQDHQIQQMKMKNYDKPKDIFKKYDSIEDNNSNVNLRDESPFMDNNFNPKYNDDQKSPLIMRTQEVIPNDKTKYRHLHKDHSKITNYSNKSSKIREESQDLADKSMEQVDSRAPNQLRKRTPKSRSKVRSESPSLPNFVGNDYAYVRMEIESLKRENFKLKRENESQVKSLMYYEKEFKVVARMKKQFKEVSHTIQSQKDIISTQNMAINQLQESNRKLNLKLSSISNTVRINKIKMVSPRDSSPAISPSKYQHPKSDVAPTQRLRNPIEKPKSDQVQPNQFQPAQDNIQKDKKNLKKKKTETLDVTELKQEYAILMDKYSKLIKKSEKSINKTRK